MTARLDRRQLTMLLGLVGAVSLAGYLTARALANPSMIDMIVYRAEGRAVLNGTDLYGTGVRIPTASGNVLPATYPPFAAMLFAPLAWVPIPALKVLVTLANIVLLVLVVHLSARLIGVRLDQPSAASRWALVAAIAGLCLWLEPVWTTLRYGQINLALLALILVDLTRAPGSRWRGVGIGVAAGIKLTPAVFIVWFLLSGRRREAAVSAFSAIGTAATGFALLPHASTSFWLHKVFDTGAVGQTVITDNQALSGAIARIARSNSSHSPAWLVAAAIVAVAGLLLAARIARGGDTALGALCCAVTGLLISPISWTHHWVWAVPILMYLAVRAPRAIAVAWGAVFFSFLVWAVPHGKGRELHLNAFEVLLSSLYPLAGLAFLAWAWIASTRAQPVSAA